MGYDAPMRLHVQLDDELVARLEARVGPRNRSAFIQEALRRSLDDEDRWAALVAAVGSIETRGHDWDDDPAAWVRSERHQDARRVG
jgi:predicted transcriptional regulator